MKLNINWFIILTIVIVPELFAQNLLTVDEAIAIAHKNNNYVQMALNNKIVSDNNNHIGNAGLLPSIDLSGSAIYNDNETNVNGIKTSNQSTNNSATISASYTLFDGLSRLYNYNKLKTNAEIGSLEYRAQNEIITYNVISAYYNVARAEDLLRSAKESLEISNERLLRTEKKVEYGQAGKIDYLNSRVDFHTDSVSYINAVTNLKQSKQKFNILLNRNIDTKFTINSEVDFDTLPSMSEMINLANDNNVDVLISDNNIELAEQNKNLSYSNYMPQLTLRSSYGYNGLYDDFNISFDDPNRSFSTTLNLSVNLFNGFKDDINKQNSEIQLKNSRLLSDQTKIETNNEVISAYQSYRDSRTILEMEIRNLEAAQLNFERTQEMYNLGKVTNTEFREAQLKLIKAKNNISSYKYNAKIYETGLKQLCGLLTEIN